MMSAVGLCFRIRQARHLHARGGLHPGDLEERLLRLHLLRRPGPAGRAPAPTCASTCPRPIAAGSTSRPRTTPSRPLTRARQHHHRRPVRQLRRDPLRRHRQHQHVLATSRSARPAPAAQIENGETFKDDMGVDAAWSVRPHTCPPDLYGQVKVTLAQALLGQHHRRHPDHDLAQRHRQQRTPPTSPNAPQVVKSRVGDGVCTPVQNNEYSEPPASSTIRARLRPGRRASTSPSRPPNVAGQVLPRAPTTGPREAEPEEAAHGFIKVWTDCLRACVRAQRCEPSARAARSASTARAQGSVGCAQGRVQSAVQIPVRRRGSRHNETAAPWSP